MTPAPVRRPILALALFISGCGALPGTFLPAESVAPIDTDRYQLVARIAHITDAQIVDEESPARLTIASDLTTSAWRPQEAYTAQLLDGFIRTINKYHVAEHTIDFVVHTGDAVDNAQTNELKWFITCFDGGRIDPRSGPDDRRPDQLPHPLLDPHHPFDAQGLYRHGLHGAAPTIPWYSVIGNHDRFAVGVFPIITDALGRRVSPMPLEGRLPLTFPLILDPVGTVAFGPVTPANPGPPPPIALPTVIPANPERRYFNDEEFVRAHLESTSEPRGHGFSADHPRRTWYSVSPLPGLRLIGLNTSSPSVERPALPYVEGAISLEQLHFLRRELDTAQRRREWVILITHHPTRSIDPGLGTSLTPVTLVRLLNQYPSVKLHLAGHIHRHEVISRGGYVEIVTAAILDLPMQGRIIELWRDTDPVADAASDQPFELRYRFFSHLDELESPDEAHADMFLDPLLPLRLTAWELASP